MGTKLDGPRTRVHFWILKSDKDRLERFFKQNIKPSMAVRAIIHNYLNELEKKLDSGIPLPPLADDDLPDDLI